MPKVLYIGFILPHFSKGGALVYQNALLEEVNNRGWDITCFFATPRYTIPNRPRLRIWYKNKIKFIELYNSYELGYRVNPVKQCYHPVIEKLTQKILEEENPDLVHFHELQMHPPSIIDIVYERKIPSLKTIHNYYDICSQRDLMYEGKELCLDFDNGRRCVQCSKILQVAHMSLKQRITHMLLPLWLYRPCSIFYGRIKKIVCRKNNQNNVKCNYEIADYHPDQFCFRRQFFIERLNKLDAIHCSSHRSAEILANHGVLSEKIKIIPLSARNIEEISPKPLRGSHYPIVFGYTGGNVLSRGYEVLIGAFSTLDQTKAKLIIWGADMPKILDKKLNIELRKPYRIERIKELFKEIDVGLIPSIWEEVFGIIGIEWLTARIPVIGSKIGGITEWLKDGENGFLVPPNDIAQLAEKMQLFIEDITLVAKLQQKIKPWKNLNQHADEMIALYDNLIASRRQ